MAEPMRYALLLTLAAASRFLVLADFTIADLVTYSWLCADLVPDILKGREHLTAWIDRMAARPSILAARARSTVPNPEECWAPGPEINRWG